MVSVADFKTRFPEFADEDDSRIEMFLDDAALLMNSADKWLDFYDVAQLYLTAHLLAVSMSTETGDSGVLAPIKGQKVDDVEITQAVSDIGVTQDELYTTAYGKRFLNYRRIITVGLYGV